MPTDFSEEKNPYWGFWATIGFGLLIFVCFSILQAIIVVVYGLYLHNWSIDSAEIETVLLSLAYNGDAISVAEIPSALIGTLFVIFLASKRKILTIKEYLDLRPPQIIDLLKWLGLMILVIIIMEAVNVLLDRETPDFMSKVYESTTYKPLLWIAVVIGAPFFEEFLFRGFLLEGLRHSKLGVVGAVIITSAIWLPFSGLLPASWKLIEELNNSKLGMIGVTIMTIAIWAPFLKKNLTGILLPKKIKHSKLVIIRAVIITSAIWAIIHVQYGSFEIFTIFLIGIVLAMAKLRTKSLYVPIAMHLFMNLTASILMEVNT